MRTSWGGGCPGRSLPVFWCPSVQGAGSSSSTFLSASCSGDSKFSFPEQIPGKPRLTAVPAAVCPGVQGPRCHVLPRGSGAASRVLRRRETLTKPCAEATLSLGGGARNPHPQLNFHLYPVTPSSLPELITLPAHHEG